MQVCLGEIAVVHSGFPCRVLCGEAGSAEEGGGSLLLLSKVFKMPEYTHERINLCNLCIISLSA